MATKQKQLAWLLGLLVMGLGCASSYHRYSGCCSVNCRYCEPGPLPYPHYPGCVCHSKPGARYLSRPSNDMSRTEPDSSHVSVSEERESGSEIEEPVSPAEREPVFDISQRPYDD
jgi:hypothetical protein